VYEPRVPDVYFQGKVKLRPPATRRGGPRGSG